MRVIRKILSMMRGIMGHRRNLASSELRRFSLPQRKCDRESLLQKNQKYEKKASLLLMLFIPLFLGILLLVNYSVFSLFWENSRHALFISIGLILAAIAVLFVEHNFSNSTLAFLRKSVNFYLGSIFIFFTLSLFFHIFNAFIGTNSPYFLVAFVISGMAIIAFATWNSVRFENNDYTISSSKLTKDYKIVHISDIHIGSNSKKSLKKRVDYINTLNADAVFITGDLVDANVPFEDLESLNEFIPQAYFIYGNHEHYINQDRLSALLSRLDLTVLKDEESSLEGLQIIGIDDFSDLKSELQKFEIKDDTFTILLNHQPTDVKFVQSQKVDLMLSGHTHGGQIWPFGYLVKLQFPYIEGMYQLGDFWLNVNSGTGTWGPRMRLGSHNEISVIFLKKEES